MSVVTDLILCEFDSLGLKDQHGTPPPIAALISAGFTFKKCDQYSGGNKAMQCGVWLAAINYLAVDRLVGEIRRQQWESPNEVQLFVKGEDDDRFTIAIDGVAPTSPAGKTR